MVLIDVDDRVDIVGIEHDRHVEFERLCRFWDHSCRSRAETLTARLGRIHFLIR